jgi:DNA polymerase-1
VRTLFGRRRLLPGLQSQNRGEVARAERLAINTPIQGSAADMIKRAMIDADLALAEKVPNARILLQVHDELLVETDAGDVDATMDVVREAMLSAASVLRVPMIVDGNAGDSWAEVH